MAAYACEACMEPMRWCGDFFFPKDRPSPLFSTFSCLINLAGGIADIVFLLGAGGCIESTRVWLILSIVNHMVNFCFALYVYFRFASKIRSGLGVGEAVTKLFFYDWGVCMYMCFGVWLIAWIIVASQRAVYYDTCASGLNTSITLQAIYIGLGLLLMGLSLCTECCREPAWKAQQVSGAGGYAPAAQTPNMYASQQAPPPRRGIIRTLIFGSGATSSNQPVAYAPAPTVVVAQPAGAAYYAGSQPTYAPATGTATAGVYAPPPTNPSYQPQYR